EETDTRVRIGDTPASGCGGNVIDGSVTLTHNRGGIHFYRTVVSEPVRLTENRGGDGVIVAGNVVAGSLDGTGNQNVGNDGMPNTAARESGDIGGTLRARTTQPL